MTSLGLPWWRELSGKDGRKGVAREIEMYGMRVMQSRRAGVSWNMSSPASILTFLPYYTRFLAYLSILRLLKFNERSQTTGAAALGKCIPCAYQLSILASWRGEEQSELGVLLTCVILSRWHKGQHTQSRSHTQSLFLTRSRHISTF